MRVVASRSIFSERAAVPLTAAEVSTISASSIVAGQGGLVDLALEFGVSGPSRGELAIGIGALGGSRELRLRELQALDGFGQLNRGRVVADRIQPVRQLGDSARDMLSARAQPFVLLSERIRLGPIW